MATADQMKALVRSHAEGDESLFYSVALQVAARAAKAGQSRFAQDLRDLVNEAKSISSPLERVLPPTPVAQPRGELAGLLAVSYPDLRLSDLIVDNHVEHRIMRVLTEHRQEDQLRRHGYAPQRSLLLVGPPGTGKTMTANVLAGELRLPLFLIRIEVLITKFMGETAAKLRLVFDAVEETRGVYLFDEVDALAGDRTHTNDVGEIRRVLNSFLQFLEADTSPSLVVAATNHPALLDKALFRRFDSVIIYPLPTPDIANEVIRRRLSLLGSEALDWDRLNDATTSMSHAELTLVCDNTAKDAILSGDRQVTTSMLIDAITERRKTTASRSFE